MERKNMEMETVHQNTVSHSEKEKKIGPDRLRGSFLDDRSVLRAECTGMGGIIL
jgi:hypothetical protein